MSTRAAQQGLGSTSAHASHRMGSGSSSSRSAPHRSSATSAHRASGGARSGVEGSAHRSSATSQRVGMDNSAHCVAGVRSSNSARPQGTPQQSLGRASAHGLPQQQRRASGHGAVPTHYPQQRRASGHAAVPTHYPQQRRASGHGAVPAMQHHPQQLRASGHAAVGQPAMHHGHHQPQQRRSSGHGGLYPQQHPQHHHPQQRRASGHGGLGRSSAHGGGAPDPSIYYPSPQEIAAQRASAQRQELQRQQKPSDRYQPTKDPFKVFDTVMKEEFGRQYKAKKAWKGKESVTDLSSINHFVKKNENAQKEFKKLDIDKNKALSKGELTKYISSHAELWKSLSRSLDLHYDRCIAVATNVAFALALKKEDAMNTIKARELTAKEFKYFHKNYILNEKGANEFFLRTIFAVFDRNQDGVLSPRELDVFLDIFYKARSTFRGSMALPDRKRLNAMIQQKCDIDKNGALDFQEVRDLLVVAAVVTADN